MYEPLKIRHCERCGGIGHTTQLHTPGGDLRIVQDCPDCNGTGHIITGKDL